MKCWLSVLAVSLTWLHHQFIVSIVTAYFVYQLVLYSSLFLQVCILSFSSRVCPILFYQRRLRIIILHINFILKCTLIFIYRFLCILFLVGRFMYSEFCSSSNKFNFPYNGSEGAHHLVILRALNKTIDLYCGLKSEDPRILLLGWISEVISANLSCSDELTPHHRPLLTRSTMMSTRRLSSPCTNVSTDYCTFHSYIRVT